MRTARIGDYRRALRERPQAWPTRLERLAFRAVPGLGEGEIELSSPITFLSGPNGVGKSTLLQGVWSALDPGAAQDRVNIERLAGGTFDASIRQRGQTIACHAAIAGGALNADSNHTVEVAHLDTAFEILRQREIFSNHPDIETYTEGAGFHDLDDDELIQIGFVSRRTYRSVRLYEADGFGPTFPFFEVSFGEDRYDSRTMGAGEQAAFLIWWILRRATPESILLIEEPETFLSPASQEAVGAMIISVGAEKKISVLATSHSAAIVAPLGEDSLKLLVRAGPSVSVETDAPAVVFKNIGIILPVEIIGLVEDDVGAAFAAAVLEKFAPRLARRIDIAVRRGHGDVATALSAMPDTHRIRFVGMLDGDVRAHANPAVVGRCVFLPGAQPIEQVFRAMCLANPVAVAEVTGSNRIPAILGSLDGQDHHDWFRNFAGELNIDKLQLFPMLFSIWQRDDPNSASGRTFVEDLERMIEARR